MKNSILAILFLSLGICAQAQAQNHKQLDSLAYILPEFSQGLVRFSDGSFSRGPLNISPLNQAVYCITPDRDTLVVDNTDAIVSVSVNGRVFTRWQDSFIETVKVNGDTGVGVSRSTAMVNNVKKGAYGVTDATSSIGSYSYNNESLSIDFKILDDPRNYVYRVWPYLLKNGKFLAVSKKAFQKLFPDKKAYIESVWTERNITLSNLDEVIAFYDELTRL